jgi:hypothetical protein
MLTFGYDDNTGKQDSPDCLQRQFAAFVIPSDPKE